MEAARLEKVLSFEQKPLIRNFLFENFEIGAKTDTQYGKRFPKKRKYFIILQKVGHKRKINRK